MSISARTLRHVLEIKPEISVDGKQLLLHALESLHKDGFVVLPALADPQFVKSLEEALPVYLVSAADWVAVAGKKSVVQAPAEINLPRFSILIVCPDDPLTVSATQNKAAA